MDKKFLILFVTITLVCGTMQEGQMVCFENEEGESVCKFCTESADYLKICDQLCNLIHPMNLVAPPKDKINTDTICLQLGSYKACEDCTDQAFVQICQDVRRLFHPSPLSVLLPVVMNANLQALPSPRPHISEDEKKGDSEDSGGLQQTLLVIVLCIVSVLLLVSLAFLLYTAYKFIKGV